MLRYENLQTKKQSKELDIFTNYYPLKASKFVGQRMAILGKSGSGKTVTGARICEQADNAGFCLLIFDIEGDYTTLKDWRPSRFAIYGRKYSEQSEGLQMDGVKKLVSRILDDQKSVIVDVSKYDKKRQLEIVRWCLEELFYRAVDEKTDTGIIVVFDEAHEYFPQQQKPDAALFNIGERVFKRGRKRHIGSILLSQRPSSINKDMLTQCDYFILHRVDYPNDIETYNTILNLGGFSLTDNRMRVQSQVRRFNKGEAYYIYPVFGMEDMGYKKVQVLFRDSKHPSGTGGLEVLRN